MHGAVEHHGGSHAAQPQSTDKGSGLPMAVRDGGAAALAALRAAVAPGHLGRGAGLVDEHQSFRIEARLCLQPNLTLARDVRSLLLAGVCGFF